MSPNILIWQIHGSYLNTLVQTPYRFYLPTKPDKPEGYGGRGASHSWSPETIEVPAEEVRDLDLGGKTDLSTLIALVARASVVVSNDTGPAHLAYALRTPSVTLFGPTTGVERWGPLNRRLHTVLRGDPISVVPSEEVLRSVEALGVRQERSA